MLKDSRPGHGERTAQESSKDLLDGGEPDASLSEGWENKNITDGDENDQSEGIQIGQHVIGNTFQCHGGGLGSKVVVDLVVCDPFHVLACE